MGGFQTNQVMEAKVAGFNMWSYVLSASKMNSVTLCENVGDLVTPSDLQLGGTASYTYDDFNCGCG